MANTNPSPAEILAALKDYNVDVKTYSGGGRSWDTVGRAWNANGGGLYGAIVHHTAARVTGYSGAPSLVWAQQYPGYPACNLLVGRGKGDTYLLSAGSCYHSGDGGPWPAIGINSPGNTAHFRAWGIEIEATVAWNGIPESVPYITDYQVEQTARTCAALLDLCGWDADGSTIVTHADWTDSGPYLGHSSYGPYRYRKNDTRRSTHSGQFWRKKAIEYSGEGGTTPDPGDGDNDPKDPKNVVNLSRTIGKNAVALSDVVGTPQTARFAALNMSNESIFLSEGDNNVLTAGGDGIFWVKGRTIVDGEENEISITLNDKSATGELIVETPWIQDSFTAQASLSLIAEAFETRYKSINVNIFGNPLIQVGDVAKFKYNTGKISFPEDKYYFVSKVSIAFENGGLTTSIRLNPIVDLPFESVPQTS